MCLGKHFLGHRISGDGISPLPERVEAIKRFQLPKTVAELRRFLALINVYKRFVCHATHIQIPLRRFIVGNKKKDKTVIEWDEEGKKSFEKCKEVLQASTLLYYPDSSKPLALFVDASDYAAGAVLQQKVGECWQPLGFYSEKFIRAVQNYSTFGRELAAMKMSVKYFRHFVEGRRFTIFTDHSTLIDAFKTSTDSRLPREARHIQYVSQYSTDDRHIKGKDNIIADYLSRINAIEIGIDYHQMAQLQRQDVQLKKILTSKTTSLNLVEEVIDGSASMYCDVSTGRIRPFVPQQLRRLVMSHFHNITHAGIRGTQRMMSERFVWPSMNKDVNIFVKSCNDCQLAKISRHNKSQIGTFDIPSSRFRHVHIDLVGPLPVSNGKKYLLTIIDRLVDGPRLFL